MIQFFKNIWRFRRELWCFRCWEYNHSLNMFKRSLELLRMGNYERDAERLANRERAVEILDNLTYERYFDMYDDSMERKNKRAEELEELFDIIRDNETGLLTWWD